MIDIGSAISTLCSRARLLSPGEGIRLATFKKDRHITIIRNTDTSLTLIRHGFARETQTIEENKLKKLLKIWIKKEFPRSNKAHVSMLSSKELRNEESEK